MTDVTVYTTSNLFLKDKQHIQSQEWEGAGVYLDFVTCVPPLTVLSWMAGRLKKR